MGFRNLQYYTDLETNVRYVATTAYDNIAADNCWERIAAPLKTETLHERFITPITSASIDSHVALGEIRYSDVAAHTFDVTSDFESRGFRQTKPNMEDSELGAKAAAQWAHDMGELFSYQPQKSVFEAIKNNIVSAWDGQPYFGTHPVNPVDASKGTFKNVLTGGASGTYPGAIDLRSTVPIATRMENFSKALAYFTTFKTFDGVTPRRMKLDGVFAPPLMQSALSQLFNAALVPQALNAASGGSANVEAVIAAWGLSAAPTYVTELGSAYGGNDTSVYLKFVNTSFDKTIDAFVWVERDPYELTFFTPRDQVELSRMQEYVIHARGRHGVAGGYPHLMVRLDVA